MLKNGPVRNSQDSAPALSEAPQRRPRRVRRSKRQIALRYGGLLLLTAALFYLLLRKVDLKQFGAALREADLRLVGLSAVIALIVCNGAAIARLWILLRELPQQRGKLTFFELTSLHVASSAAHNLLPAPAGEVMRTVQLYRLHGFTVGILVAAQLVEKIIESIGLGTETLLCATLVVMPPAVGYSLYAFSALGTAGAVAVVLVAWQLDRRHPLVVVSEVQSQPDPHRGALHFVRGHLRSFIRKLAEGIRLLRRGRVWAWAFLFSAIADLANALTVGLCLYAVGIALPVPTWFLLMLVARAAGLIPSTPGQFGVLEAGLLLALVAVGVDKNRALAFSLLYHTAHFAPVTLVGLIEMRRQWR